MLHWEQKIKIEGLTNTIECFKKSLNVLLVQLYPGIEMGVIRPSLEHKMKTRFYNDVCTCFGLPYQNEADLNFDEKYLTDAYNAIKYFELLKENEELKKELSDLREDNR